MNRVNLCRGMVLSTVIALGCFSASSAHADDAAANPKYTAWSKFKPGSFATIEADVDVMGKKYHIKTTRTLVSIDSDKAVVETKSSANIMGQNRDAVQTATIEAKGDSETFKQTGEKDVEAMGKTFKCKVFDDQGNSDQKPSKAGPANPDDMKATVYISEDVPGGLVKLEGTGKNGQQVTFVLTAMESK